MAAAYSELYLDDAMRNLGEMTEYALEACGENLDRVLWCMVVSGLAERWEKGDPQIICGLSGTELWTRTAAECGMPVREETKALIRYETGFSYWSGYTLAYYQWRSGRPFAEIRRTVTEDYLLRLYPALHTASEDRSIEWFDKSLAAERQASRLAEYRKRLGLTQKELAERSGISRRTIEEYEVQRKDLRKAGADRVLALARILQCRAEELV